MEANIAFLRALRDVQNGKFGTYKSASLTSYVIDPTDETLWDLKPVLGRTLELLGVAADRGYTTHDLVRLCRTNGVLFEHIVYANREPRPLGMRTNQLGLDSVDWEQASDEQVTSTASPNYYFANIKMYRRNSNVVSKALKIADGVCQACKENAPFISAKGDPFLEVHHMVPLSAGGEDVLSNVIALCPNCHRKQHFGNPDIF